MNSTSPNPVSTYTARKAEFKTHNATAHNPWTNPFKLERLAHLDNESLWRVLITNPSANADTLRYIYQGLSANERSNLSVAKPLVLHQNTPEDVLFSLAEERADVSIAAMTHPNMTFDTLQNWVMVGNARLIYFWDWMFHRFPEETSALIIDKMVPHVGEDLREALNSVPLDFLLEQYAELFYPDRPAYVKPFTLYTLS